MNDLQSRVYRPDPVKCCERCVFGRGPHAEFCTEGINLALASLTIREYGGVVIDGGRNFFEPSNTAAWHPSGVIGFRRKSPGECAACAQGTGNHAEWCSGAKEHGG